MTKVTLTTELPISAEAASALARKPEFLQYLLWPIVRLRGMNLPVHLEAGSQGTMRLWWFGIIPAWTHHLAVKEIGPTDMYTNEQSGPIRTWNHRLAFTSVTPQRCRYTDEVETDGGWRGWLTGLFIRLLFRYRHYRWHTLARILAE